MVHAKEIQSERLILRKVTENDVKSLYNNWDSDVEIISKIFFGI